MKTLTKLAAAVTLLSTAILMQSSANALGPAANYQTGYACTNSGGALIMRAGPGQNFAKLASIAHGTDITVLSEVTGRDGMSWYKVRIGKRIGYVRYDFVCGL